MRKEQWVQSIGDEVAFWTRWMETKGLEWPSDYAARCDPDSELSPHITRYLGAPREITVLDVGSGPMTCLGKRWAGHAVRITACDALAEEFRKLPYPPGHPLVPVLQCDTEVLTECFPSKSFDVVHARNTLDHSYDPMHAIVEMVQLVKPDGVVVLDHHPREATRENHAGLHQFDFYVEGGRFYIEGADRRWDVFHELSNLARLEVLEALGDERCFLAFRAVR